MRIRFILPWWMYVIMTAVVAVCVGITKRFLRTYGVDLIPDMEILFFSVVGMLSGGLCGLVYAVCKIAYDERRRRGIPKEIRW